MTGRQLRGCLIAALAVIAGSAGLLALAAAVTLTVGKAAPNADPIIPVNVGDTLGIFKKHGLDLKIVDFTGGSKMTQAMAAGALDIGDGAGTEMALIAKGAPMIAVCESAGPLPLSASACRGIRRSTRSISSKARISACPVQAR